MKKICLCLFFLGCLVFCSGPFKGISSDNYYVVTGCGGINGAAFNGNYYYYRIYNGRNLYKKTVGGIARIWYSTTWTRWYITEYLSSEEGWLKSGDTELPDGQYTPWGYNPRDTATVTLGE